ncbi:uncharacterized protein LOC118424953 [Branchiostoma floridae]|uniref:Uncharacterized protein LOC118424953 n=1 Tax=Branchiostoma floridae TaxID=7739 RepID=A0A9J7LWU7_BRAFL|nr:uncharacterized protein LOC118424953 [Branchiostoma floridae]
MEGEKDMSTGPEFSPVESDKTSEPASQSEDQDSVGVTQQGHMVHQDVADLLDDQETNEPLPDEPTEKAEVVVRRKELKAEIFYFESKKYPELEIQKKELHLSKISECKAFVARIETTLDSIRRSATESESNHVSSTNTASCKDDTIPEATHKRGVPDGQLNTSMPEKQINTDGQLQDEIKTGNDTEDSSATSRIETRSASFLTPSTSMASLENKDQNKQPTVDQNTVHENPDAKEGLKSDAEDQESEESSHLEDEATRGVAGRDDTSTVPLNGAKVPADGKGRDGYTSDRLGIETEQGATVQNVDRNEFDGLSAANSSHPLPRSNGLDQYIEDIDEAFSGKRHTTPAQREQLQFHAGLPSQQTTVPPEADDNADRNHCGDTDPLIRRKGSSKSTLKKSYEELHSGQPPGCTEKRDKKAAGTQQMEESKVDEQTEVGEQPQDICKSAELGATASQADTSTEEDQEPEGAVGGMTCPPQQLCHQDVIIDATNRPGQLDDRPVGKVKGVPRTSTDEVGSETQVVLTTPESGPPAFVHCEGEQYPRRTAFEVPGLIPQEEEIRAPAVRDRSRRGWPHNSHQQSPRAADTPVPGWLSHHKKRRRDDAAKPGDRVPEQSSYAVEQAFERGRTTSFKDRAGIKNHTTDWARMGRYHSCPPVCFVQPYKDQKDSVSSSRTSSSDHQPQRDRNRVVETRQRNNRQEPRIRVLDNAQQFLAYIRTSPTPVEQIAYSIRETVFQEVVLTAFTLWYPGGDIIPQGTLLGGEDVTVLVVPAESPQPGQWRIVNNM